MADGSRRRFIITFKPKDQRPDGDRDKAAIVRSVLADDMADRMTFFTADDMSRGLAAPSGMPSDMVAYDVNRYSAPIVMARLTEAEVSSLGSDDNVASVEEDQPAWALSLTDALLVEGQPAPQAETIPAGVSQVKAPLAWDGSRGKAINVAILDTGIDGKHPDLAPNFRGGASFIDDENSTDDFHGHGTHCAGTVAAAINGLGVVGVAPAASLYAVKVLNRNGSGSYSSIIAGIDWSVNKKRMHVVSMSLGGSGDSNALKTMCQSAFDAGVLLVAAAGNAGPPPAGSKSSVRYPALYDSVIAVSAIGSDNTLASFSSRGPKIELCAPGVQILSTAPGGGYQQMSGTSMACPHTSGVAALAWGAHRYQTNVVIRRLLAHTADELGNPGRDDHFGFGRVDANQATLSTSPPPAVPGLP